MASKDSQKLSYEQAREALAEVINELESGQATLEESMKLWERGEELAKICQEWLDGASATLNQFKKSAGSESENEDA
jgi:exodeoxyribonuclease VII small subunit